MNNTESPRNSHPSLRFLVPLAFQALLILAIPARAVYTSLTGETVVLQTVPVDPYDLLRGYYQTLQYDISRQENLEQLPGWNKLPTTGSGDYTYLESGTRFYVIMETPENSTATFNQPLPWKPVAVSLNRPDSLPENQIALEGESNYGSINYGLEKYYMPEDRREEINADIQQVNLQPGEERPFVVEIKVDRFGNAVPVSLWVESRNYRF
ncbi:MAG: GDYXXLXY domain-containing protein [Oscillatoria sp. PMC 1068.18]|nr:GDYXXLXY domain-containing protein [Oscillatoria sp. PMC 1076.18]MEC4989999.1 GDYXXLXY domain-containing protein [Oscillatoria sp. PMC 1068.18]